jgi:Tol biopolymer transport system component
MRVTGSILVPVAAAGLLVVIAGAPVAARPRHEARASGSSSLSLAGERRTSFDLVFSRFTSPDEPGTLVRIAAGTTSETPIRDVLDAGILSPDGSRFLDFAPTADDRASAVVFGVDGSNELVLPLTDPRLDLPGGAWSAGSTRIAAEGWGRDGDPHGVSVYSRRASDGGGLIRLTDAGDRHDYPVSSSRDGSRLLFFRPDAKGETSDSAAQDVFVVDADGRNLRRLSPVGTTTAFTFSHDAVSWSADGAEVAMVLANGPFWSNPARVVSIAALDGSGIRRVGPRGDIWDAVWSPDGRWIAFSFAPVSGGSHQLFVMHPDGTGVRALTSGQDGRYALQPTWTPDSHGLAFIRGVAAGFDDPHVADVWTVNLDGSELTQVTDTPSEYRGLAWLP